MKKILIVEDELLIALDIKNILTKEGYEVVFNVINYEQAIENINNYNPDLVLIDIKLKGEKDGIAVGQYLDKKFNHIPYIFITSYTDEDTLNTLKKNTAPSGFIVKPFLPITLKTSIEIILNNIDKTKINTLTEIPEQLKKVIEYINANLTKKIEVNELYQLTSWNQQSFALHFKNYLKTTPYQFVIQSKINYAKEVLKNEDIKLKDLAFDLGFISYSNFYNAFFKYTNQTPESYIIKNKK